ncbi:MAG: DUF4184 family protein [Chromatiales bacterium]|nr:DUF4184 family protein [Chromatiales bacterium]
MPFTPLHLGPGLAIKLVLRDRFSVVVFAGAQVAMDVEPLVRMLRGDAVVHGPSHTYLGALLVGVASMLIGKVAYGPIARTWNARAAPALPTAVGWAAAGSGAFLGTTSHVLLDSLMHGDMQPFAPLTDANTLLLAISIESLHLLCIGLGAVGAVGLLTRTTRRERRSRAQTR